jgi:NAD-dependent deacetylase
MLAELLRANAPAVVLTGAGVSTESGIPDFRSASGLWANVDPFEVASIDAFRSDPVRVWDFYARRLSVLAEARPNAAHHALAALERAGLVRAVLTQNVDGLHTAAGSADVIELHGSLDSAVCLACGARSERDEVEALLPLPRCTACGEVLKPGVVLFGELLPAAALERATRLARSAPLLVAVGSSLEVHPAAGLLDETARGGGRVAIVNREPTAYDSLAELVVRGSAGDVLSAVQRELDVLLEP